MKEVEWFPIEGFPDYSINPLGQVRHEQSRRMLHPRFNQYGVPYVGLMNEERQCNRSLPLLVAKTFIPTPNPIFDTPINLDGDRSNCAVHNLAWRPRWYAVYYVNQFKVGRYENPIRGRVREIDTGQVFSNSFDAACAYGLLEREVVMSVLNQTYTFPNFQQFELC